MGSVRDKTETLTLPPPEEIEARIAACRDELRALSRLLRMSRAARVAANARAVRATPWPDEGTDRN
jgi:hypothetical protein